MFVSDREPQLCMYTKAQREAKISHSVVPKGTILDHTKPGLLQLLL